jgi:hypothetical protein
MGTRSSVQFWRFKAVFDSRNLNQTGAHIWSMALLQYFSFLKSKSSYDLAISSQLRPADTSALFSSFAE